MNLLKYTQPNLGTSFVRVKKTLLPVKRERVCHCYSENGGAQRLMTDTKQIGLACNVWLECNMKRLTDVVCAQIS